MTLIEVINSPKNQFNMISKLVKAIIILIVPILYGCDEFYEIVAIENLSERPIYMRYYVKGYESAMSPFSTWIEPHEKYEIFGDTFEKRDSYFKHVKMINFIFMDSKSDGSVDYGTILLDVTLNEAQLRALGWTLKYPLSDADKEIIEEYKTSYEDSNNRQS